MRHVIALVALAATAQTHAGTINIPWTVDLLINRSNVGNLQEFSPDPQYTVSGRVSASGYYVEPGITFETQTEHEYRVRLPMSISISAPDEVSPGQRIKFNSSVQLTGSPLFGLSSALDFGTELSIDYKVPGDSGSFGWQMPDELDVEGVSFVFAGERTASATTNDYRGISAGTPWRNDPWGQPLEILDGTSRFLGYGMTATGSMDAWSASADLLTILSYLPSPAGTVASVVGAVADIPFGMQIDVVDRVDLQTNFLTAFFSDDGGTTYDNILLNQISGGYVPFTVPNSLNPGDTYTMEFTAMGLGFNTVYDMLFQAQFYLGVDLDLFFCCDPWSILEANVGDPWLIDRFVNSYQYIQFMDQFMSVSSIPLTFSVVAGLDDNLPPLVPPALEDASINSLIAEAIAQGDNRNRYDLTGSAPTGQSFAVPEPGTLALLGLSLAWLGLLGRRKAA